MRQAILSREKKGVEEAKRVLMINRVNAKFVTPAKLANLFGCFGVVTAVLVNRANCYALVELQTKEQAAKAMKELHNLSLFRFPMKIKFSRYSHLCLDSVPPTGNSNLAGYALTPQSPRLFPPPEGCAVSCFVLIEHLPSYVDSETLLDLLSSVHRPIALTAAGGGGRARSCLAEFVSINEAINVVAEFNNVWLDGRSIRVVFSPRRNPAQRERRRGQ